MTSLSISRIPRNIFITYACRYAKTPIHIKCTDCGLAIQGMTSEHIAQTLAAASFPAWELARLTALGNRKYKSLSKERRRQIAVLAQVLIFEDITSGAIYRGMDREQKLADIFAAYLTGGTFNFDGFCRFNLPGYDEYLLQMLLAAEETLIAKDEEEQYLSLLKNALGKGCCEINLFFSAGDICQIWQKDKEGLRQLEGGHIHGVEWLLLANLICLDPAKIIIRDSIYAAPILLDMLESVFAERIVYEETKGILPRIEKIVLDKARGQC